MTEKKENVKNIVLFALLLSGAITIMIFIVSFVAELFLQDPISLLTEGTPRRASVEMLCYILSISLIFLYILLKEGIQEKTISRKSGIVAVALLTYLFSSISLAVFLSLTTEIIDYEKLSETEMYPTYSENMKYCIKKLIKKDKKLCTFNLKESFFDAISGFTTTGLTAFERTYVDDMNGEEISKIDVQPNLIHIIRASYLWIGGLGIMFFYLYFTPVPSLMMSMGYKIPSERSLPKFIRLESFTFSLVYVAITALGILLLFLTFSSSCPYEIDNKNVMTYSVVLTFSSISTGGFSPTSEPIDQIKTGTCQITDLGLLIIMVLMLAGAIPIFSLHRPLKFFRKWIAVVVVFLLPILIVAVVFYHEPKPRTTLYRSFDAISAFTTTGLYTSQFEEDFGTFSEFRGIPESKTGFEIREIIRIYRRPLQDVYMIVLMFIGGAAYSTAGGWGFFNAYCIIYALYLVVTGKFERGLLKYIFGLILSFIIFFSIFAIGTFLCYRSGLFGTFLDPESTSITDYIIPSAFYEISALSTVGLMPSYNNMSLSIDIYYHNLAYWTLAISMLIGRLYYIIFPFLVSAFVSGEER